MDEPSLRALTVVKIQHPDKTAEVIVNLSEIETHQRYVFAVVKQYVKAESLWRRCLRTAADSVIDLS